MTYTLWTRQQMNLKKLAKEVLSYIQKTSATRVLVTSTQASDGKARLINEMYVEMGNIAGDNEPFVTLEATKLHKLDPRSYGAKLVVVYGPAYFDPTGLHALPELWLNAFDTAIVVVMARKTQAKDLTHLLDWLKTYGMVNIGLIWNEFHAPPFDFIIPRLKRRLGRDEHLLPASNTERISKIPLVVAGQGAAPATSAHISQAPQPKVPFPAPANLTDAELAALQRKSEPAFVPQPVSIVKPVKISEPPKASAPAMNREEQQSESDLVSSPKRTSSSPADSGVAIESKKGK